jgi:hypothetical protein
MRLVIFYFFLILPLTSISQIQFNVPVGGAIKDKFGIEVKGEVFDLKVIETILPSVGNQPDRKFKKQVFKFLITVSNNGAESIQIFWWDFKAICPENNLGQQWQEKSYVNLVVPYIPSATPLVLKPGDSKTIQSGETDFYWCLPQNEKALLIAPKFFTAYINYQIISKEHNSDNFEIPSDIKDLAENYKMAQKLGMEDLAKAFLKTIQDITTKKYPDYENQILSLLEEPKAVSPTETVREVKPSSVNSNHKTSPDPNNQLKPPTGDPVIPKTPNTVQSSPSIINVGKSGIKKNITEINIPDFNSQNTGIFPDCFIGSQTGVYIAFTRIPLSNPLNSTSHIHKLNGTSWITSTHERVMKDFSPSTRSNENPEELSYYWVGTLTMKENMANVSSHNGVSASVYGHESKNNGNPSFKYYNAPSGFLKIITDKSPNPKIWALAPKPDMNSSLDLSNLYKMDIQLYYSSGVADAKGYKFDFIDLGHISDNVTFLYMAVSDLNTQNHVWIAVDQKVIRATDEKLGSKTKDPIITDLSKYGASGSISKIRCKNGVLWVLCGNDLFKIVKDEVQKFYTINSSLPSFAVDDNYIYTNDGAKISLSFKNVEPLMGDTYQFETNKTTYTHLKNILSGCLIETSLSPVGAYVYALSVVDGKVFLIPK